MDLSRSCAGPVRAAVSHPSVGLLAASGLPHRWQGRNRFVLLVAGADVLSVFVAAWRCRQSDSARCRHLHVIAVGPLPTEADSALAGLDAPPALRHALMEAWPPLTRNLHRLAFDDGRVQLLLAAGDARQRLRELIADVDAFVIPAGSLAALGGATHGARALARLAAPGATLVAPAWSATDTHGLESAGFAVEPVTTGDGHRRGCYAPRHRVRERPPQPAAADRHAVIVGGGLAGCATAWALAEQGWSSCVLERHAVVASEGSGNVAGLFHGSINPNDGTHARFNRAAALEARRAASIAIASHGVAGATEGLLQLVRSPVDVAVLHAQLHRLDLPAAWIEALDTEQASARAGIALDRPAWFHAGGGWIDPRGLARSFLKRAGTSAELRCGQEVSALRRDHADWTLLGAAGRSIVRASTVVLACAGEALSLAGGDWPLAAVRGQLSIVPGATAAGWRLPSRPVAGAGYLLPAVDGSAMFGATAQVGDDDLRVRIDDHRLNLEQLARLVAPAAAQTFVGDPIGFAGRTAWRWVSRDRLPLIGAVPRADGTSTLASGRCDLPRFMAREPGLFLFTALGSRGITWAALGAQVLASSIAAAPMPLEADLVDAIDPARFRVRDRRRASGASGGQSRPACQRAAPPSAD